MSKYLITTLSLIFILSCSNGVETVTEETITEKTTVTEADAKEFLAEVEQKAKTDD